MAHAELAGAARPRGGASWLTCTNSRFDEIAKFSGQLTNEGTDLACPLGEPVGADGIEPPTAGV
jgi:hypothetical protein